MMASSDTSSSPAAERLRTAFGDGKLERLVSDRALETVRGLMADLPAPLLTIAQIEEAFARRVIKPEHIRVNAGRLQLDLDRARLRDGKALNLDVLAQVARQGVTIVINRAERYFPALVGLMDALADWVDEEIFVAMVLTYGDTSGLKRHHDDINLFVLQLDGTKDWTFFGAPVEVGAHSASIKQETGPESHLTLHAGDAMFVPAGLRHECSAAGYSLHLGVTMRHGKASDVAERFAKVITDDPAMNAPLLHMLGEAAMQAQIEACRARLHALVDTFDLKGELAQRHARKRRNAAFAFPETPAS